MSTNMTLNTKVLSVNDNLHKLFLIEKLIIKDFKIISSTGNRSLIGLVEEHKFARVLLNIIIHRTTKILKRRYFKRQLFY